MTSITGIKTREYKSFRGVDFSNSVVSSYRSPNSINMWKNYEDSNGTCIETRPGMKLLDNFGNQIFGLFFYKVLNTTKVLLHVGTKLLNWDNYPTTPAVTTELFSGLNPANSQSFVHNNIFFLKDGINYIEYDGTTCKNVEPTIPITSIGKKPSGEIINDNYGHQAGDLALKRAAELLCTAFPMSSVFRIGGDEFVIIPSGIEYARLDEHLRNIKNMLDAERASSDELDKRVSISVGSAVFNHNTDHSYRDVYERADMMMYEEKQRIHALDGYDAR